MTEQQTISTFTQLTQQATELGLEIILNNGFNICFMDQLLEHVETTKELKLFLNGYKAAQIHAEMGV
jgi:ribulose bisphosphate carboxylase small subunit